ncbi:MAG: hypothetical protein DMD81_04125 [Candidatus Rokuibacteriota bacterium]|nr:MAG: hypothetical protein DMD81_04125 [Candidatus Rokubacteria bacterium]
MRVTLRIPLAWTSLLAFFFACAVACVVAWFILLSTICSNPRTPVPQTQHVIPYNCHGMKVFISPSQDARLHWLVPVGLLCIALSLAAATMVVQAVAKAWQSDVRGRHHAEHVRIFAVPPGEAPAWVREKWRAHFDQQTYGWVLSGPRTAFAVLSSLMHGQYQRPRGFTVNVLEAIRVLESSSPEAANWWRVNAPHLMKPSHCFLFPEDVGTIFE